MSTKRLIQPASVALLVMEFLLVMVSVNGVITLTAPNLSSFGEQRIIVVPVYTQDYNPILNVSEIYRRVFESASQMLMQISYNKTWLTGYVTGWFKLEKKLIDYGENEDQMVKDAIAMIDPWFDFSDFDRVLVFHAGPSKQTTLGNESYPSNSYSSTIFPTMDLRTFIGRIVVEEECAVRTIVHEVAHALGAVDLYNRRNSYDNETVDDDPYVGFWGLMGHGYEMCLFNKLKIGFVENRDVYNIKTEKSESIELLGISESGQGFRGAKFSRYNDSCYYLIEARTKTGLDQYIHEGVLITLVNENKEPGCGIVDLVSSCNNDSVPWAAFRVGESFYDSTNDFVMHVEERTSTGFRISIGSTATIGSEQASKILTSQSSSLYDLSVTDCVNGLMYSAISKATAYPVDFLAYVEVFKSRNSGITWDFLFNTTGLGLNFSYASIALRHDSPVVIGSGWNQTHRQFMLLNGTGTNYTFHIIDPGTAYFGASCSSRSDGSVFFSWGNVSTSNGKWYVNNGIWNGESWILSSYYENATYPILSNVATASGNPYVMVQDSENPRRRILIDSNHADFLNEFTNETLAMISDCKIIRTQSSIVIALQEIGFGPDIVRVLEGSDVHSIHELGTLENVSLYSMYQIDTDDAQYIGLLVRNYTHYIGHLFNVSSGLSKVTDIDSKDLLYTPITIQNSSELVILSASYGSRFTISGWKLFIGPVGPISSVIYVEVQGVWLPITPLVIITGLVLMVWFLVYLGCRNRTLIRSMKNKVATSIISINWFSSIIRMGSGLIIVTFLLQFWNYSVPSVASYQLTRLFGSSLINFLAFWIIVMAISWSINALLGKLTSKLDCS